MAHVTQSMQSQRRFECGKTWTALVGIGMGDIHSMTTSALNAVQNADLRILESYTAKWNDNDIVKLKETVGEFEYALRPEIENPDMTLSCQEKSVAVMVIGVQCKQLRTLIYYCELKN